MKTKHELKTKKKLKLRKKLLYMKSNNKYILLSNYGYEIKN
jgi:hypothetical protein